MKKAGRLIAAPRVSRLVNNVGMRLRHMDSLGIGVQVLDNTLFLYDMTEEPEIVEKAAEFRRLIGPVVSR